MSASNPIVYASTLGKKQRFDQLGEWGLAALGAPAFLVSSFFLYVITQLWPEIDKSALHLGFTVNLAICLLPVGGFAVVAWLFGCIALRCHNLLFERLFQ